MFGRQGAQDCGDVWLRNSLAALGEPVTRVPLAFLSLFGVDAAGLSLLTGFSLQTTIPALRNSPEDQVRPRVPAAQSGQGQRVASDWGSAGRLSFAHLREEVVGGKVGCRDSPRPPPGLQASVGCAVKESISLIRGRSCFHKRVSGPDQTQHREVTHMFRVPLARRARAVLSSGDI